MLAWQSAVRSWGPCARAEHYLFSAFCPPSMLMDMLHATLPPTAQRIHFHAFMVEAHKRMHAFKSSVHKPSGMVMSAAKAITAGDVVSSATNPLGAASAAVKAAASGEEVDPIPPVARALAKEHDVVCFDEFQVRNGLLVLPHTSRHADSLHLPRRPALRR